MKPLKYTIARNFHIIAVLIATWIFNIVINLFSTLLETWIPITISTVLLIASLALVFYLFGQIAHPKTKWVLVTEENQPDSYQGMIILVGPGRRGADPLETAVKPAIEYHLTHAANKQPLSHVWLIASQPAIPVANAIRTMFQDKLDIEIIQVDDAFSVQPVYQIIKDIYEHKLEAFGLQPSQVISDFTGGTKLMSAGMVLACQNRYPMQYMSGKEDAESTPIMVRFKPEETQADS